MAVTLGGNTLNVWHDGFEETITLVCTEWNRWDHTNYIVVNTVYIHGRLRTWRLRCHETGVNWAASVVQTLQGYVDDNTTKAFIVAGEHTVNTTVKVLSVELAWPEGSNVGTRDRSFIVTLQEAS